MHCVVGVWVGGWESHHECDPNAYICCGTYYCCRPHMHRASVVRRVYGLVGGWVGGSFRTWVSAFVPVGGGLFAEGGRVGR